MRRRSGAICGTALVVLLSLVLVGPAAAKTKTKTFQTGTPVAIPAATDTATNFEAGAAASTLDINKKGTLKDVNVGIQVTHPDTSELGLYAFNASTYVPLSLGNSGPGANTENYGGGTGCTGGMTTFDGASRTFIDDASNPFVGSFLPDEFFVPMRVFDGTPLKGTWKLVANNVGPDTGTINCFQVTAKYKKKK